MEVSSLLSLGEDLVVERIEAQATLLTIYVCSTVLASRCPRCQEWSDHLHSHYQRVVADLPCGTRQVRLLVQVPKFRCQTPTCPHKVFAHRLTPLIAPWARQTTRLTQALESIGLATSGELGARLASRLSLPTSPTTLLRRIMVLPTPPATQVSCLGIDEFSFRRGQHFGTILVDVEQHRLLDLLPDRDARSAAAWMRRHREIQYVSRDRGKEYAKAARKGAPQATQIADRFHLVHNLVEAIEPLVSRTCQQLRQGQAPRAADQASQAVPWRPTPSHPNYEPLRLARLAENQERFAQMRAWQQQGIKPSEIARRLRVSERTVQRWSARGVCPDQHRRRKRRSPFDRYAPYVLRRWHEGCREVKQLWQEMTDHGFRGSLRTVYHYVRVLRQGPVVLVTPAVLERRTSQEALWLLVRDPEYLKADERADLRALREASSTLEQLSGLVHAFGQMVRQREGQRLDAWMQAAVESGLAELQPFVRGLRRDQAAVQAGLTLPYSNGVVEGFVNKLKLIKRMMYGRANFALLRQRVLHAA